MRDTKAGEMKLFGDRLVAKDKLKVIINTDIKETIDNVIDFDID